MMLKMFGDLGSSQSLNKKRIGFNNSPIKLIMYTVQGEGYRGGKNEQKHVKLSQSIYQGGENQYISFQFLFPSDFLHIPIFKYITILYIDLSIW